MSIYDLNISPNSDLKKNLFRRSFSVAIVILNQSELCISLNVYACLSIRDLKPRHLVHE